MASLTDALPAGLRPVGRRPVDQSNLSLQTRRIVIPRTEKQATQPEPAPVPRIAANQGISPTASIRVSHFYLHPSADQALINIFPNGIRLSAEWLYIGRNPSNEADALLALVLNRDEISKVHAAVMEFQGKIFVADLGSSNGTSIIRNQVTYAVGIDPVELALEDTLSIGSILFRIARR